MVGVPPLVVVGPSCLVGWIVGLRPRAKFGGIVHLYPFYMA
jgi:hypothetical protein